METVFGTLTSTLTTVLSWIGAILDALLKSDGALSSLWPLAMVGICFGVVRMGIGYIKSFTWGF